MHTGIAVPVEEYLNTSYRPDCDYVDGEVVERNVGEWDHSRLQMLLGGYLSNRETQWRIVVVVEQRVHVKPNRYRIPDITVVAAPASDDPIIQHPPLLCIEILSREDRLQAVQERIDDYLAFGVPCIWVIDPRERRGFVYTQDGMKEAKDGILRLPNSAIEVPLPELS